MRQSEENSCATYLKNFEAILSVLEHLGIQLGAEPILIECAATELGLGLTATLSTADLSKCKATAMERFQAIVFLYCADTKRYSNLLHDLENLQSRGEDQYPKMIADAYNMLAQYKAPTTGRRPTPNPSGGPTGVSFLQAGATAPGADTDEPIPDNRGLLFIAIRCFHCNRLGHYSSKCPFKFPTDTTTGNPDTCLLIDTGGMKETDQPPPPCDNPDSTTDHDDDSVQMIFHQTDSDSIPNTWVLLDSQLTVNIFKNPAFLTNMRESPSGHLRVLTNSGVCTSHLVGDLPNFGTVWFNPQSLANILSLWAVCQICRVTMNTDQEAALSSELGSYVQVFEHNDPTNTTKECTTGTVTLNPTGNTQGGYFFMSLTTGRRLNRRQWTALPMTTDVMQRVNNMGEEEGQPLLQGECPIFEWVPGVPIVDNGIQVEHLEDNNHDSDDEEEMPDLIDNYEDSDSDDDSDDEDDGDNDNNDDDDAINDDRANNDDGSDNFDQNHNPDEVFNGDTATDSQHGDDRADRRHRV